MEFGCVLQFTLDEIAGVLIFSLCQPVDHTPLLINDPSESRLRHWITHPLPIVVVCLNVDDIVFGFGGIEESADVLCAGHRISAPDHEDTTMHRIREQPRNLTVRVQFPLDTSMLGHGVPRDLSRNDIMLWLQFTVALLFHPKLGVDVESCLGIDLMFEWIQTDGWELFECMSNAQYIKLSWKMLKVC